jgi:hypothetical protein
MKGYVTALGLSLLLGAGGAAHAVEAVANFEDASKNTNVTIVKNADGAVTEVKEGSVTAIKTGGTADGTAGYLYLDIKDALFTVGKPLFIQVEYLDRGTDTWQLEYGNADDPVAVAQPVVQKNDTGAWKTITFKQVDADLQGGQEGKSDIRINDNGDGAEIIRRVIASDIDPQIVQFPKVDPAHPIVLDAKKGEGEWDGAFTFVLDQKEQDAIQPSKLEPGTFGGTYSMKWDEKGFYVFGEVVDATPRMNDAAGPGYWNGDGMELFLALNWADPNHTAYLPGTDFHTFYGMGEVPAWANEHRDADDSANVADDNGPMGADMFAIVNTDKGYNFELFQPWTALNPDLKVTEGQQIGFYMFANNSTVLPSAQEIALTPYRRNGPSGNPSRWATALLAPAATVAPAPTTPPADTPPTAGN